MMSPIYEALHEVLAEFRSLISAREYEGEFEEEALATQKNHI